MEVKATAKDLLRVGWALLHINRTTASPSSILRAAGTAFISCRRPRQRQFSLKGQKNQNVQVSPPPQIATSCSLISDDVSQWPPVICAKPQFSSENSTHTRRVGVRLPAYTVQCVTGNVHTYVVACPVYTHYSRSTYVCRSCVDWQRREERERPLFSVALYLYWVNTVKPAYMRHWVYASTACIHHQPGMKWDRLFTITT